MTERKHDIVILSVVCVIKFSYFPGVCPRTEQSGVCPQERNQLRLLTEKVI